MDEHRSAARSAPRVALVTGGARRIGAALVARLAELRYAVVIHASARAADEAEHAAQRLRETGSRAAVVVADLADAEATGALIARAAAPFGALTLLVNNASIFEFDDSTTFEATRFDRHMAINLRAPILLATRFAAQASSEDPSIVNILDQRALKLSPLYLSYTLSKAGLVTATTTLAQALAPRVRVNAVAPGPVLPNVNEGDARFVAEAAQVPLARPVPLEAIADAVEYLARARLVTGETIAVDGGQRIAWRTPDVIASMA